MEEKSIYSRAWDHYVETGWERAKGEKQDLRWPGDEWGDPKAWAAIFRDFFAGVEDWKKAVEIGQGSGKYTGKVLRNSKAEVRAYDVSAKFLNVAAERLAEHVESGRLSLRQIDTAHPSFLLRDLDDWKGEVDAVYSIAAMVHVDLQYLMAYLITASAVLKPGGKLILSLANVSSDAGFRELLEGIRGTWEGQASPTGSGKFEWLNASLVADLLPRLGFEIDQLEENETWSSLYVVASLSRSSELERYLLPQP
jgi:SAM-dependent methyltransferase